MLKAGLVSLAALAVLSLPAMGESCPGLIDGPKGIVASVTDGDTVILDNGLVVRLVGTQAPKLALDRPGFTDWPLGEASKATLERLVLGKPVLLRYGGEQRDRYDRVLAQMFVTQGDELWVQQAMLAAGMARVYSFPDNRSCLEPLFGAEAQARANRIGLWADRYYGVQQASQPQALAGHDGRYELVEGRVLVADSVGGRVYLNFGRNWNEDFTAVIEKAALRLFAESGRDPLSMGGALVRVRGWIDDRDGPRMSITHPEQIEVLAIQ
ncbi:MAG TPA: thermonuclease family protein [Devosiaceae bacterium]